MPSMPVTYMRTRTNVCTRFLYLFAAAAVITHAWPQQYDFTVSDAHAVMLTRNNHCSVISGISTSTGVMARKHTMCIIMACKQGLCGLLLQLMAAYTTISHFLQQFATGGSVEGNYLIRAYSVIDCTVRRYASASCPIHVCTVQYTCNMSAALCFACWVCRNAARSICRSTPS